MLDELKDANEYIVSKINETDPLMLEMEAFALEHNVPIVTKEVAEYLKFLVESHNFKNILEIGTAIGYSGTIMGNIAKANGGKLTTIEIDEVRYQQALENFKKAGLENNINAILGDGIEEVKKLDEKFDFIFIDASKGHYMEFFNVSFERLSDNLSIIKIS